MTFVERCVLGKLYVDRNTGCWNHINKPNVRSGYVSVHKYYSEKPKRLYVHRLSYEYFNGKIPNHKEVMHQCNNKRCCNPSHLFIGTRQENMQDAVIDNLFASKLSESDVRSIRLLNGVKNAKEIAKDFGIHRSTIYKIWKKETWKHIP